MHIWSHCDFGAFPGLQTIYFRSVPLILTARIQITLAFVSLYNILGWPAFVGVAIMIVSIPLNTLIARFLKRLQEKQMKNRDKRTRLMSDLLANIRRSVALHNVAGFTVR